MKKHAIRIGKVGSALGAFAGFIEMSIGNTILPWIGKKESPTILGLITLFLSAIALISILSARNKDKLTINRKLAIFLGVFLPATICFTTVGRLWYLPGFLLIVTAFLLGYEYWFVQAKFGSSQTALRKYETNQIMGGIGSLLILLTVVLAFFNSNFGLYQYQMPIAAKPFRFEVLPMDIARITNLSGSMIKIEDIELHLVMIVYILLIVGATIALISSLVKSKMFTGIGGILVLTALSIFLLYLPVILAQAGIPSMSLQKTIGALAIGWYLFVVGTSLILLSSFLKISGENNSNAASNP